jgi:hypothetical protein
MSTATLVSPSTAHFDLSTNNVPWNAPAGRSAQPEPKTMIDFPLPPSSVRQNEPIDANEEAKKPQFSKSLIKSISLPSGWNLARKQSSKNRQSQLEIYRLPTDPWFQIDLCYRGEPASQASSTAFACLLDSKPADCRCEVLMPKEIRELAEVMGSDTVGNNQFTNKQAAGSKCAPIFHLRSAQTMKLNGKTVLSVQGDFVEPQDPERKPVNAYEGIFIDGGIDPDTGARKIQEVFMHGPASRLMLYRKQFVDTLKSIEWPSH